MIKRLCGLLATMLATVAPADAADAQHAPTLAWHFTGIEALAKSNPEAILNEISASRPAFFLAIQVRNQLATLLPGWLDLDAQALGNEVISPLLADLLNHESAAHFEGEKLPGGAWVLAVQVNAADAGKWNGSLMNLGRRLLLGEPAPLTVSAVNGWQIPGNGKQRGYGFFVHRDWVVLADGFASDSTAARWVAALAKDGRPLPKIGNEWLHFQLTPAAIKWRPNLPFAGEVARIESAWSWQGKDVRTSGKALLSADHTAGNGPWQIPKGIARDPLISFTAVRGMKPFLGSLDAFKGLAADLVPEQWFGWTRETAAFIDDFALPVKDEVKVYEHLERSIPAAYNPRIMQVVLGEWKPATNMARLLWRGLPVLVPYVGPRKDGNQGFIYGGIFPLVETTNTQPAPDELFAQFEKRTNLAYYDWEITPARLTAYQQASPFIELVLTKPANKDGTHAQEWLQEAQPKLANAVTEAIAAGPRELSFTRKSQTGMTAIEMWLLARWLDSAEFPKFPYGPTQRPQPGANRPGRPPATPQPGQP